MYLLFFFFKKKKGEYEIEAERAAERAAEEAHQAALKALPKQVAKAEMYTDNEEEDAINPTNDNVISTANDENDNVINPDNESAISNCANDTQTIDDTTTNMEDDEDLQYVQETSKWTYVRVPPHPNRISLGAWYPTVEKRSERVRTRAPDVANWVCSLYCIVFFFQKKKNVWLFYIGFFLQKRRCVFVFVFVFFEKKKKVCMFVFVFAFFKKKYVCLYLCLCF